jgi:hypothetical protein
MDSRGWEYPLFAVICGGSGNYSGYFPTSDIPLTDDLSSFYSRTSLDLAESFTGLTMEVEEGERSGGPRGGSMRYAGPVRRRGSKVWYARVRDPRTGVRSWRSTGTTVLRVARLTIRRWELQEAQHGIQSAGVGLTVAQALRDWIQREGPRPARFPSG